MIIFIIFFILVFIIFSLIFSWIFSLIGKPALFTGRQKELKQLLDRAHNIEEELSKSIAILSRRKSGKTAVHQRLYNIIRSENGKLIPFYLEIEEKPKWIGEFCQEYYLTFLSQYYSFKLRKTEYANMAGELCGLDKGTDIEAFERRAAAGEVFKSPAD